MKLWSPRSREDWKTWIASTSSIRAPHFIIDITKDTDGNPDKDTFHEEAMKSENPAVAEWHTSDGSAWWLRDASYSQPSGDYTANCYMDLWHSPPNENAVSFDDNNCTYHARSYYCQKEIEVTTTTTTPFRTFEETKETLVKALDKAIAAKQLILLEAGRLQYLADYMKERADVIKDKTDLAGNAAVWELMDIAGSWGDEILAEVKNNQDLAWAVNEEIDKGNTALAGEENDDTRLLMHTAEVALETSFEDADHSFKTMMTHQVLISPKVETNDLTNYDKVFAYFDEADADVPSTCSGPSVAKPVVGKSYAECASACDLLKSDCIGFTFFPSLMCFLHRSVMTVTYYEGCSDDLSSSGDQVRLSCAVKKDLFAEKYNATHRVKVIERKQNIRCPVYSDEGVEYSQPVVLTAEAWDAGTFIINAPGEYHLAEDVLFYPQTALTSGVSANDVSFPDPLSEKYPQLGGYYLGFFTAIAIQSDDVVLDCKGHSIGMHPEFHKRQRFFSVIELGSKPFFAGGPPQFGNSFLTTAELVAPKRVTIKNCTLGRSSHHGIHGNNNEDITIQDLVISDFEVGGIHFNGANRVTITDTEIGPSLENAFGAALSQANLLDHLMNSFLPMKPEWSEQRKEAKVVLRGVEHTVESVLLDLHNALHEFYAVAEADYPTWNGALRKIFRELPTIPDGSAVYGVVIHKTGPAANDFGSCTLNASLAGDLQIAGSVLTNVNVHDLKVKVHQMTRIVQGSQIMGPAGDVFDFELVKDENGHYAGTVLSDAQLAVNAFKEHLMASIGATDTELLYYFGASHVSSQVWAWVSQASVGASVTTNHYCEDESDVVSCDFKPFGAEGMTVSATCKCFIKPIDDFSCFGDAMSHANKGAIGLFLNHMSDGTFSGVTVRNIANVGYLNANSVEDGGDAPVKVCQTPDDYNGPDARGVALVNSPNVECGDGIAVENGTVTCGVGGVAFNEERRDTFD